MKRIFLLCCVTVLGFSRSAVPSQPVSRYFECLRHDINQIEMCVTNFGRFGQHENGSDPGLWWPKGTNRTYIYGAGLWFGTIVNGDTLCTRGYGPLDGETEFTPGLEGMTSSDPDALLYLYPNVWPPSAGTYPMAPQSPTSHQDSWCAYNDFDATRHTPGDTRPIGLEVYQTVYAWNLSSTQDIIFMRYQLVNKTGADLHDVYFGVCADNDIGNEAGTAAKAIFRTL